MLDGLDACVMVHDSSAAQGSWLEEPQAWSGRGVDTDPTAMILEP